jgi:succinyl-CoA synthetase beta subunit
MLAPLSGMRSEQEAIDIFEAAGVPAVKRRRLPADRLASIGSALSGLRFPVVAKVSSADIPHKSEYGGVKLHLDSVEAVCAAINEIAASIAIRAPAARIDGYLIQEQRLGLQEAILGLKRDPAIGPVVTLGMGGVLAEIYADIVVKRAPVTQSEAMEMIDSVRGFATLRGYRGRPTGDIPALAKAVADFSQLGAYDRIAEAEINPLMVGAAGEGVWAVDGRRVLNGGQA